ncbi:biotin transporter BioY [Glutamicibacter protophormiae]|uniref:biotin transporter BioY n=1 Tax=Glutamicibacter protophormiae TaxID=37930 RepID=UPI00195E4C34|nr:biotin transporter BioY [Glutamicibacter protophormiae]QRQ80588.1 biotin transporter BioY [Glutamicibacter protophormiae]
MGVVTSGSRGWRCDRQPLTCLIRDSTCPKLYHAFNGERSGQILLESARCHYGRGPEQRPWTSQLVLGFARGTAAVGLYVLLGLIGLPIFSGFRAGPAVLASPSAGYIVGFIFGAAVIGLLATLAVRSRWRAAALFGAAMAGTVVIHVFGIVGFVMKGMNWATAVGADAIYLPGDIIKNVLAVVIALSLHRAFPDLLVRRQR